MVQISVPLIWLDIIGALAVYWSVPTRIVIIEEVTVVILFCSQKHEGRLGGRDAKWPGRILNSVYGAAIEPPRAEKPPRPGLSFQIEGGETDRPVTLCISKQVVGRQRIAHV